MNIKPNTKAAYQLLHNGILAFAHAEETGMRIDVDYCQEEKEHLTRKIKRLERKFKETKFYKHWEHVAKNKVNMYSNVQLSHFLYKVKKIKPVKLTNTSKQGATDEETLSQLGISEIDTLLEIRKLKKVRDTYLDAFLREQVNGVLHPFFNLHTTRTYRSSSDSPNFQNIPIRDEEAMNICRRAFLPRPGYQLLDTDYSGIEVLIACCYTEDDKLIYDATEGDMHRDMAMELYMLDSLNKNHPGEKNLRQGAKNGFVFPEFYGSYYENCAPNLLAWAKTGTLHNGISALEHLDNKGLIALDGKGEIKKFDKFVEHVKDVEEQFWNVRYKKYTRWKKRQWERYQRKGYIEMFTGFRCGGVMSRKQVINSPIQGTAFHCLLWSFIRLDMLQQAQDWDSRLIGQIHDDIVTDIHPKELQHVAKVIEQVTCEDLLEEWKWIIVPLKVEMDLCEIDQPWNTKRSWRHDEKN
jgi:DNA polymerase-1